METTEKNNSSGTTAGAARTGEAAEESDGQRENSRCSENRKSNRGKQWAAVGQQRDNSE